MYGVGLVGFFGIFFWWDNFIVLFFLVGYVVVMFDYDVVGFVSCVGFNDVFYGFDSVDEGFFVFE